MSVGAAGFHSTSVSTFGFFYATRHITTRVSIGLAVAAELGLYE